MVRLNRIYTRTGDAGTTGLVDGSRLSKADARMTAIGDVDEANSALGVAIVAYSPLGRGVLSGKLVSSKPTIISSALLIISTDGP